VVAPEAEVTLALVAEVAEVTPVVARGLVVRPAADVTLVVATAADVATAPVVAAAAVVIPVVARRPVVPATPVVDVCKMTAASNSNEAVAFVVSLPKRNTV